MRYTKYNYKKKKNNDIWKSILSFVVMSVFVIIVGVLLANVIIYFLPANDANENLIDANEKQQISENTKINSEEVDNNTDDNSTITSGNNVVSSFVIVQCGYFSSNENANVILSKISSEYSAFIFNDSDKFKVLAGIYNSDEADSVVNKLTSNGIESAKVTINLNVNDEVQSQVSAICDGYLKLLNTSLNSDVKSVSTDDFKTWVSNLDSVESGDKIEVLNNLKQHINESASEIKKEDVSQEMQFIYTTLINFS